MSHAAERRMGRRAFNIFLGFLFLTGIMLLAYPPASDLMAQLNFDEAISEYRKSVDPSFASAEKERAYAYNRAIAAFGGRVPNDAFADSDEGDEELYFDLLDPIGTGIMCTIEIPSIGVRLPVYHGTDENALQKGAGHLKGASLPIGTDGSFPSHSVIAAHSGLPGASMFDRIDSLGIGDWFCIGILDEEHWYEVESKSIVDPGNTDDLVLAGNGDYVTLVTCTPYGINSHRLLVRGVRGDGPASSKADASFDWLAFASATAMLCAGIFFLKVMDRRCECKRGHHKKASDSEHTAEAPTLTIRRAKHEMRD